MKILLIHTSYQQPGGEDVVFEQECSLLQRAGHEVIVYRRDNREAEKYFGAHRLQLAKNAVWSGDSYREVKSLLRRHRPDVTHIPVSYTHLRAHETRHDLVCRLLLE